MDHLLTADERAFRDELAATLRRIVPADLRDRNAADRELARDDFVAAQKALHAAGLAVPHWPAEWGGRGWTATQRFLWMHEIQVAGVPQPLPFNVDMIGPVLCAFGSGAQKARFLPATAALDIWWCQGFSEPGAGSDLAGLSTRAVRDGDAYVVDGQKTWTSYAQHADWIFALVRTDPAAPRKQMGISFLLIDMGTPGISVRPIRTADGRHEVNEVFFDSVRVPAANLVGAENRGWDVAKFLLANERHAIAGVGLCRLRLGRAAALMAAPGPGGRRAADEPALAGRLARHEADLAALETLQLLALKGLPAGAFGAAEHAASVLKIRGTELQQATTELLLDLAVRVRPEAADDAARGYFSMRKVSIYGGSNEVQREILAKAALGV
ncbi:MAG: acyl-CoA dehydrogenase family protein [Rhodobacteraceae bacterium]|jgi:alkylation response protein AidB-like acyl-CoA dehydrogenase|nr:acyl-CoA dehydrogenase family protein [Paracoccaceae bacterium]